MDRKKCKPGSYAYRFVYACFGYEWVHECENCTPTTTTHARDIRREVV